MFLTWDCLKGTSTGEQRTTCTGPLLRLPKSAARMRQTLISAPGLIIIMAKKKTSKKAAGTQKVEITVKTEAPKKAAKKKTTTSKPKYTRPYYRLAKAGTVAAIVGAILKLTAVTGTFPYPADVLANVIIFCAIIGIAIDFAKGGIMD